MNNETAIPFGFTAERVEYIKQFIRAELPVLDNWDEHHWAGEHDFDVCFNSEEELTIALYATWTDKDGEIQPATSNWCEITVEQVMSDDPLVLTLMREEETP